MGRPPQITHLAERRCWYHSESATKAIVSRSIRVWKRWWEACISLGKSPSNLRQTDILANSIEGERERKKEGAGNVHCAGSIRTCFQWPLYTTSVLFDCLNPMRLFPRFCRIQCENISPTNRPWVDAHDRS